MSSLVDGLTEQERKKEYGQFISLRMDDEQQATWTDRDDQKSLVSLGKEVGH